MPLPDTTERWPIVVMFERDPWLTVIGSDVPSVVAYEDGSLIYVTRRGDDVVQLEGRLEPNRLVTLAREVAALVSTQEAAPEAHWEDLPTTEVLVRVDETWTYDRCYGLTRRGLSAPEGGDPSYESRFFDAVKKPVGDGDARRRARRACHLRCAPALCEARRQAAAQNEEP